MVPEVYWSIITIQDMERFLLKDIDDISLFECKCALTPEEKEEDRIKKLPPEYRNLPKRPIHKLDAPLFSDVLPVFITRQKTLEIPIGERRMIILIRSSVIPEFSEIQTLERNAIEIFGCVPLVFTAPALSNREASIQGLIVCGQRHTSCGMHLAFDLDETLTRWPEEFSAICRTNRQKGGFNLIISTRHEPSGSSHYQAVVEQEKKDIDRIGLGDERFVHAWLDFKLSKRLFPYIDPTQWFTRFIWTKAFYCRLFRIDCFYEDQKRNIERLNKIAPDVRVVEALDKTPPDMVEFINH